MANESAPLLLGAPLEPERRGRKGLALLPVVALLAVGAAYSPTHRAAAPADSALLRASSALATNGSAATATLSASNASATTPAPSPFLHKGVPSPTPPLVSCATYDGDKDGCEEESLCTWSSADDTCASNEGDSSADDDTIKNEVDDAAYGDVALTFWTEGYAPQRTRGVVGDEAEALSPPSGTRRATSRGTRGSTSSSRTA